MMTTKHVYEAITAVTATMASEGISKSRKNDQQGYRFRGIDDVYAAIGRPLADNHLCILPRVLDRTVTERPTKMGGISTYVVLTVEFDFVSSKDGSTHTVRTMGEAMDSADKATNKAMSAAMKYACLMTFAIPTEGDNDSDASHPEKAQPSSSPSLEKPLADSIAMVEWTKLAEARLLSAATMGDLLEAWSVTSEEAKKKNVPSAMLKKVAAAKDVMKAALAPKNGAAASQ